MKPKVNWVFPSFNISLQLLASESTPVLGRQFRQDVVGAVSGCPRMCKKKFKKGDMKRYFLLYINRALGTTKVRNLLNVITCHILSWCLFIKYIYIYIYTKYCVSLSVVFFN